MKQWFAILALLWVTAAAQTAEEQHPQLCVAEFHAATISPETGQTVHTDDTPLLATSAAASGRQLCSPTADTAKGGRTTETLPAFAHKNSVGFQHDALTNTIFSAICQTDPANIRTTGRYIYFLRRIII